MFTNEDRTRMVRVRQLIDTAAGYLWDDDYPGYLAWLATLPPAERLIVRLAVGKPLES